MTPRTAFAGAAAVAALLAPAAARAQCSDRAALVASLAAEFGERALVIGLMGSGAVIEIFAAPGGASWTILITHAGGASCLVASGTGLMPVLDLPPARRDKEG